MQKWTRRHFLTLAAGLGLQASGVLAAEPEGRRFALLVGISNYKKGYAVLDYAGDDASRMRGALKALHYQVSSLTTDAQVGAVNTQVLAKAVEELLLERRPEDTVLFYFSGHGSLRGNKQYLLCTDTDPDAFEQTAFCLDTLGSLLKTCRAKNRILIIDACRSTAKADGINGFADGRLDKDFKTGLNALAGQSPSGIEPRAAVLFACKPGQRSKENDAESAGFFTLRLVEALSGKADALTAGAVMNYVQNSMPAALHGIQDPTLDGSADLSFGPLSLPNTAQARRTKISPIDGAEMIYVSGGKFTMGDADQNDNAPHEVTLSSYYIYKNTVTVAQYKRFCAATGHAMPETPPWGWKDDHPVVNVSWEDAQAYCKWVGVRLPTEAEWEMAARGADHRLFPWGSAFNDNNLRFSKAGFGDVGSTAPVGSYPSGASPYGVLDMAGNVWQWCSDWYDVNYCKKNNLVDPTGPNEGVKHSVRGGSWDNYTGEVDNHKGEMYFRSSFRSKNMPTEKYYNLGFRCASPQ